MRTLNQQRADISCHIRMAICELNRIDGLLFEYGRKYTQKDLNSIKHYTKETANFLANVPFYRMEDLVRKK